MQRLVRLDAVAKALLLPGLVAAALVIALINQAPPAPKPPDAPDTHFSAMRAFAHVEALAREPRPSGSRAQDRARDYLVTQLKGLGLAPQVQRTQTVREVSWAGSLILGGEVENVLARIPGTGGAGDGSAVLLMAHFDSRPHAPGAADDAAGVAAILETLKALRASGDRRRDVIALFTDGEEGGLLGARAFFDQHPWADRVGLVLNAEARGSRGPAFMFETSDGNAPLIKGYDRAVRPRLGNAVSASVYRRMPNSTDLSVAFDAGKAGLNFAFIDGYYDYHSATDTPENLSQASLQSLGEQILTATQYFANRDGEDAFRSSGNAVYFGLAGLFVHYGEALSWPLTILALAGLAGLIVWAVQARRVDLADLVLAITAHLRLAVLASAVLLAMAALVAGSVDLMGLRRMMAQADALLLLYTLALAALLTGSAALDVRGVARSVRLAVAAGLAGFLVLTNVPLTPVLVIAAALGLSSLVVRPVPVRAYWLGGLLVLGALALAAQILLGAGAYLFVWPLLFGVVAAAVSLRFSWPLDDWRGLGATAAGALPALLWATSVGQFLYLSLGLQVAPLMVFPALLILLSAGPLAVASGRALGGGVPVVTAGLSVLLVGWLALTPDFDARHPRPARLLYLVDGDRGQSFWVSADRNPGAWEAQLVSTDPQPIDETVRLFGNRVRFFGRPADPAVPVPGPTVSVSEEGDGRALLTVRPSRPGTTLLLTGQSDQALRVLSLNGQSLADAPTPPAAGGPVDEEAPADGRVQVLFQATPEAGLSVRLSRAAAEIGRAHV